MPSSLETSLLTAPVLFAPIWSPCFLKDTFDHLIILLPKIPIAFKKNKNLNSLEWHIYLSIGIISSRPFFTIVSILNALPSSFLLLDNATSLSNFDSAVISSKKSSPDLLPGPHHKMLPRHLFWPWCNIFILLTQLLAQYLAHCRWMNARRNQKQSHREDGVELTNSWGRNKAK